MAKLFGLDDEGEKTAQGIADFLGKFMSPEIANFLSTIIKGSLGDVINNTTAGAGIVGPGALLGGPRDIGNDIMDTFSRRTIQDAMAGSERILQRTMMESRILMHKAAGADQGQAEQLASQFNLQNIATSVIMSSMQNRQFQSGAQVALGYAGTRPLIGFSPEQEAAQEIINNNAKAAMNAISAHAMDPTKIRDYFGIGGADKGRLLAEMARTGVATGRLADIDTNLGPMLLQQRTEMVSMGQQFFQGGAMQVTDQINSLLGVNAANTLGGADVAHLMRRMQATGAVTGMSNQQMLGLAHMSAQFSRQMGRADATTAMVNASEAGLALGNALGAGGQFVNEPRLSENIIRNVTIAGGSDIAKTMAGAFTMIEGDERQAAFLKRVRSANVTSRSEIGRIARDEFDVDATNLDMLDASYTFEAQEALAEEDEITETAYRAQVGARSGFLRSLMRLNRRGRVANKLEGRPVTVEAAKEAFGKDTQGFNTWMRSYTLYARGMNTTVGNMNAEIKGSAMDAENRNLRAYRETRVDISEEFKKYGKISGLEGLASLAGYVEEGKGLTTGKAWGAFLGLDEISMGKIIGTLTTKEFGKKLGDLEDLAKGDEELMVGADVVGRAFWFKKLDGKTMTKEQRERVFGIVNLPEEQQKAELRKLGGEFGRIEFRKNYALEQMRADLIKSDGAEFKKADATDEVERLTMLKLTGETVARGTFLENVEGMTQGKIDDFNTTLAAEQAFIRQHGAKGLDMLKDKGYIQSLGINKEQFTRYNEVIAGAAQENKLLGSFDGDTTGVFGSIETLLRDLIKALTTGEGGVILKKFLEQGG